MMRGTKYIWQQEGWPHMQWDDTSFSNILAEINLLRDGPEVSLNGSPTVSPTIVAL